MPGYLNPIIETIKKLMKPFSIGRDEENHLCLRSESVSGKHGEIIIHQDLKTMTIQDLGSTNGTRVNGQPVITKRLRPGDKIQLGDYQISSKELFQQIDLYIHENRTDFSQEFGLLRNLEKEFQRNKIKADKYFKLKSAALRIGITILVMMGLFQYTPGEYRFYMMGAIGLFGTIVSTLSMSEDRLQSKIEDMSVEFSSKFCCPKCKMELMGKSWKYWHSKKSCPKCKCYWTKPE